MEKYKCMIKHDQSTCTKQKNKESETYTNINIGQRKQIVLESGTCLVLLGLHNLAVISKTLSNFSVNLRHKTRENVWNSSKC